MSRLSSSQSIWWWLAVLWLALLLAAALLADVLPLPYAADTTDLMASAVAPLTGGHWLGTDSLGRDVLAGLLFGARTAVLVSLPAAALATLVGTALGSAAGFWGNKDLRIPVSYGIATVSVVGFCFVCRGPARAFYPTVSVVAASCYLGAALLARCGYRRQLVVPLDRAVLVLIALLASVPLLILALTLAALYPPSLSGLLAVLVLTYWPGPARLVRAEVLRVRALPYIESARALGLPTERILRRHVVPNIWHTVSTTFPISVATLIGLETTLSFLGVGLPPETASWGRILASARLAPAAWWLILWPALTILLTTLSLRQLSARNSTD